MELMENYWTGLRASSQIDINLSESVVRYHAGKEFIAVFHKDLYLDPCCLLCMQISCLHYFPANCWCLQMTLNFTVPSAHQEIAWLYRVTLIPYLNGQITGFYLLTLWSVRSYTLVMLGNYCLSGAWLDIVEDIRDLGIQNLNFMPHGYCYKESLPCFRSH